MAEHLVMRPKDYDLKHVVLPCYVSPKLDGVRAFKSPMSMMFRSGKPIWGVGHIYDMLPRGIIPDGEMLIPGIPFQESAGRIRSHNQTPDAHLYIFDYMNSEAMLKDRYQELLNLKLYTDKIHIIKHTLVHTMKGILAHHQRNLDAGFEGSVVKNPYSTYHFGKSWDWMRLTPVKSVDLKITGVYEGKGKYQGMMGGVVCNFNGIAVRVGTGWDDDQRKEYWADPTLVMHWTIRIEYKELTQRGSLRHPSFDRFRYHK